MVKKWIDKVIDISRLIDRIIVIKVLVQRIKVSDFMNNLKFTIKNWSVVFIFG